MKSIASRQNAWFKRIRDAIRDHESEIAVEGPKMIRDAIAHGWEPIAIAARSDVEPFDVPAGERLVFTRELFDALADTKSSQGAIGLFARPRFGDIFSDRARLVVALDGVQDPGNVGTIVRLAAAFDAGGVALLPGSADAFAPKAIRASAGAILSVPVVTISSKDLIERGRALFAAQRDGDLVEAPASGVIVFGSEGSGVSAEIAAHATTIAIPMSDRVESLNVGSAAAILLSQSYARRRLGSGERGAESAME